MTLDKAYEIIGEETKLKDGKTGLIVFDIDDTLLHADSSVMGIIIKKFTETGKWENVAWEDTAQFAKSPYKDDKGNTLDSVSTTTETTLTTTTAEELYAKNIQRYKIVN